MSGTGKCILVCDDETGVVNIVRRILESEGHEVLSAYDGLEVFSLLEKRIPDAIIIDRLMPGMDGLEVLSRLKESPATASIPIIMLTSMGKFEDVIEGYQHGADCYITKPFTRNEIVNGLKLVSAPRPEFPETEVETHALPLLKACHELSRRAAELTLRFAEAEKLSPSAWLYKGLDASLRRQEIQMGSLTEDANWRYCFHGWGVDYFNAQTGEEVNLAIGPGGRSDTFDEWRVQCYIENSHERGAGFSELHNVFKGHAHALAMLLDHLHKNEWIEPAKVESPGAKPDLDSQLGDRWAISQKGLQFLARH